VLPSLPAIDCAGKYSGTCSTGGIRPQAGNRTLLRASYTSGRFQLKPELNYVGELELSDDSGPNQRGTQESLIFANLNGSWDFNDKFGLFFGVNNVFDEQPPVWGYQAAGDLNVNVSLYDPIGRTYFLGIKAEL
jgi:outer membrane receptor protein involved in Fe transport